MMNLIPQVTGQIPVSPDTHSVDSNILDEMDAYFNKSDSEDTSDSEEELVFN